MTDVTETATLTVGGVADASVNENSAYTGTATLTGAIGTVTWALSGDDGSLFTLSGASNSGVTVNLTARNFEAPDDDDTDNVYEYTLTATDADGNTDDDDVSITVTNVTETATLTVGGVADASVNENAAYSGTATLTGTPIGTVTWALSGDDGSLFTLSGASNSGVTVNLTARNFEAPDDDDTDNTYEYTLTATDADGNTDDDDVSITVTNVTETATLTVGGVADVNVAENSAYTGTATLTGAIGTVTWALSGDDGSLFTLSGASNSGVTVNLTARNFEAPDDDDTDNVYEYTLTATDADGNTDDDDVSITVTNVTETATLTVGGVADASVNENAAYSGTATLTGTPIGTVTWALSGDDGSLFTLSGASNSGVTVNLTARNFEAPDDDDTDNTYEYTLTATDADGNTDDDDVSITVTDVTETATLTVGGVADVNVAENSAYTGTATLTGAIGTVTWALSGDDGSLFTLSGASNSGVTVNLTARNFEAPDDDDTDNVYEYTLTATDADGNTDDDDVSITVTNVTETATLTVGGVADANVAENAAYSGTATLTGTPIGTVTWALSGDDGSLFTLSGASNSGVTVNLTARNFEAPDDDDTDNVYEYTLTATDADGNTDDDDVSITVTNVTETATLTVGGVADASVNENAAYSGTATLTGTPIGTVTWALSGDDGSLFTLSGASNSGVTVNLTARNFEAPDDDDTDNTYEYTLTATDADGNTDDDDVSITVTNVTETATLTVGGVADVNVAENAAYSGTATLTGTPIGTVTWSLSGDDGSLFTLSGASNSGVTVNLTARNFEAPDDDDTDNVYEYTLTATDADGNTDDDDVSITVTNVTETATLTVGGVADASVNENAAYSGTATLTGTPIGTVTWSLSGDDGSLFTLSGASNSGVTVNLTARNFEAPDDDDTDNVYEYTLTATDADGNTDDDDVSITVTDVTETATLTVGGVADASVNENAAYSGTATLTGTPIGTVTWALSGDDGSLFSLSGESNSGVTVSLAARDFEAPGDADTDNVYEYTLTATDADGNTDDDDVSITVNDVSETATLTLGGVADVNVAENAAYSGTATLTGTPIGVVTWALSGDDGSLFSLSGASNSGVTVSLAARNFEAPGDADTDNTYEYTLTATDGDGNTAADDVSITVTNVTETATLTVGGVADASVNENAAYSGTATLTGTPIGTVTWTLSGDDASLFSLSGASNSGVTVSLAARDFEAPGDDNTDNTYEYTLTATDADGNTDDDDVSITVTNVTETATLTVGGVADVNVAENTAYTGTVTLTGTPIGSVTWALSGDDGSLFSLSGESNSGVTVSLSGRDFEDPDDDNTDNTYEYTLTATDADGNSDDAEVSITVTDVSETATLTVGGVADASVAENAVYTGTATLTGTPIGSVTWSLSGDDGSLFTLSGASNSGVTVSLAARDFEAPDDENADNVYAYTLTATDADGNSDNADVSITVSNLSETATLTVGGVANANVAENAAYTGTVTLTGTPIGSVTWALSGDDGSLFSLSGASNSGVTVSLTARDFEAPDDENADNVYAYTLTATDADGNSDNAEVSITVTDVSETATLTVGGVADVSVAENTAYTGTVTLSGTPIGSVTWTLSGDDGSLFSLSGESNSGVTVTLAARNFEDPGDADTDNTYEYTLTATDADGNTAAVEVSITVTDASETATLTVGGVADANVAENAAYTGTATLTGTPFGTVTWTLSGADGALFTLSNQSNSGVTVTLTARDFEAPGDADTDNVYAYTLTATDGDGNTAAVEVSITVTDVSETATLTVGGVAEREAWPRIRPTPGR